jgi:competence protein ComEA
MLKKMLTVAAALSFAPAFASVDANLASEAELDAIKGVGPATSRLIIAEREKAEFKNWDDFIRRVKGMGRKSAIGYSAQGLSIGGAAYAEPSKAGAGAGKTPD